VAAVKVVSVETREFSDSSLDCPQPGMSYLQVITPGHRVLLEADGRRFDVRTSGGQGRICRRRKPDIPDGPDEAAGRDAPATASLADSARRALAARLDTQPDAIGVLGIRSRRPGESLPGCQPDCEDAVACGYVIELLFDRRQYTYLGNGGNVAPCPAIETG